MEIKIQCGCGTKYKFDVEPVHGRMPAPVACPNCGANGTTDANEIIARSVVVIRPSAAAVPYSIPDIPPPSAPAALPPQTPRAGLRISREEEPRPESGARAPSQIEGRGYSQRSLLERNVYLIKERVAVLKLTDTYDILDPATGQTIGIAKEEPPGWAKWVRLAVNKQKLPTAVNIYEGEGQQPVLSIRRGFTFLRSKIQVVAGDGRALGYFKSKLISIGGGFNVFDAQEQQVAEVKGDWKGWNFRFLNKGGREIGAVTKKWAGLGKELFTSADNYVISITDPGSAGAETSALLLAAGLSIDIVYKEAD